MTQNSLIHLLYTPTHSGLDEGALLAALEKCGLVDHVMNTLDLSGLSQGSEVTETRGGGAIVEDQCVGGVEGKIYVLSVLA